jgi:hypothetical protein
LRYALGVDSEEEMMKYFAALALILFAFAPILPAQAKESSPNTANPIVTTVRQMEERYAKNLTGAADEMPAAKYDYRPTSEQITFAHLIAHSADANNFLCAAASGEPPPAAKISESASKETLTKALKDSFTHCEQILAKTDDSTLGKTFTSPEGQTGTRGSALVRLATNWADHYSAAAMYLRLNNLLPPSAKKP